MPQGTPPWRRRIGAAAAGGLQRVLPSSGALKASRRRRIEVPAAHVLEVLPQLRVVGMPKSAPFAQEPPGAISSLHRLKPVVDRMHHVALAAEFRSSKIYTFSVIGDKYYPEKCRVYLLSD